MTVRITMPGKSREPKTRGERASVDPKDTVGWVYFAESGGFIKIGHSRRLAKRIQTLRSSCPGGVTLLGVIRGDKSCELNIHELFRGTRSHGEWFRDTPGIRFFITRNCDPTEAQRAILVERAGVRRAQ